MLLLYMSSKPKVIGDPSRPNLAGQCRLNPTSESARELTIVRVLTSLTFVAVDLHAYHISWIHSCMGCAAVMQWAWPFKFPALRYMR